MLVCVIEPVAHVLYLCKCRRLAASSLLSRRPPLFFAPSRIPASVVDIRGLSGILILILTLDSTSF